SNDVPITSIATYQQKGATSLTYIDVDDKKINSPEDIKGMKIGSTTSGSDSYLLPAFLEANNISEDEVNIVNMEGDAKLSALLSNKVDFISGDFYYYEAQLRSEGEETDSLIFSDYGANAIGNGFIANDEFLENNPEIVEKFLQATFKAIDYTYDNLDESIQIFIDRTDYTQSADFIQENLEGVKELRDNKDTKDKPFGWNSEEVWEETLNILYE